MDYTKLSNEELRAIKAEVEQEIQSRKEARKADVLSQLRTVAQSAGYSLEELMGKAKAKARTAAKVKYRDPNNPTNTWAGRGRKPKWLEAAVASGKQIEDFAV